MVIDRAHVGRRLPDVVADIEAGRLRAFASAIGETDPIYHDVGVARSAGHRSLPAPPTFLFGVALAAPDPFAWVRELGIDMGAALHGSQSFVHHHQVCAGHRVRLRSWIAAIEDRNAGALELVVQRGEVTLGDGTLMCETETVTVVRNLAGTR